MNVGDTVYVASATLDNLPFYQPREATVCRTSKGASELLIAGWSCAYWFLDAEVFTTREQAQERIIAMARRAREISDDILGVRE